MSSTIRSTRCREYFFVACAEPNVTTSTDVVRHGWCSLRMDRAASMIFDVNCSAHASERSWPSMSKKR